MTEEQYIEAMENPRGSGTHPVSWGGDVLSDYKDDLELPYCSFPDWNEGEYKDGDFTTRELANYYFHWFPLVKDSLK